MSRPLLIAHRGDRKNFPENTIVAFESAFAKGADGIEFDVHLNDSSEPIVVHNYLFDRSQSYPRLEQVLELFGKKGRLEMEIKSLEENAVATIADVVARFRPIDLEVTSSVQPLFPLMTHFFPNDRRGLIFRRTLIEEWMPHDFRIYWITRYLELCRATVLHLDFDLYFPELISALQERHIATHTHLSDASLSLFEQVQKLGIDQCTFDDIAVLKLRS